MRVLRRGKGEREVGGKYLPFKVLLGSQMTRTAIEGSLGVCLVLVVKKRKGKEKE